MIRIAMFLAASVCLISAQHAQAEPITFSETFTASGTLGSSTFTNATVTFSLATDTSQIGYSYGEYSTPNLSNSVQVTISGLSTVTLSDSVAVFSYSGTVNFEDTLIAFGVAGVNSSSLNGYNLQSAIGPTSGSLPSGYWVANYGLPTTSGNNLEFTSTPTTGSFTATATPSVPEPSSFLLCLTAGAIGLVYARRKRA